MTDGQHPGHDWAAPNGPDTPSQPTRAPAWGPPPAPTGFGQQPPPASPAAPAGFTFRSWQPGILALRPLPFGDFLTVPFRAMRFNRVAVVGAPLLMFLASALITGAAIWIAATDRGVADIFSATSSAVFAPRLETIVAFIIAGVVWVLSDTLSAAVVVPAVAQAALGKRLSLGDALRAGFERIWSLLGLGLLTLLASAALLALVFAPVLLTAASNGDVTGGIILTVILGFVVFIPGLFVISVYLPVARGAIMLEKIGPIAATLRAIRLVPGRFWWTVLILIVIGAINGAIQQVLSFGTQIVTVVAAAIAPESEATFVLIFALAFVLQMLASAIVQYSFVGSAAALIYLDMRFRKEGLAFDMAKAAEAHFNKTAASAG